MDTWKVTFSFEGIQPISVNVNSNNEYYARENAKRKLHSQYEHLIKGKSMLGISCKRLTNNKLMDRIIFDQQNR